MSLEHQEHGTREGSEPDLASLKETVRSVRESTQLLVQKQIKERGQCIKTAEASASLLLQARKSLAELDLINDNSPEVNAEIEKVTATINQLQNTLDRALEKVEQIDKIETVKERTETGKLTPVEQALDAESDRRENVMRKGIVAINAKKQEHEDIIKAVQEQFNELQQKIENSFNEIRQQLKDQSFLTDIRDKKEEIVRSLKGGLFGWGKNPEQAELLVKQLIAQRSDIIDKIRDYEEKLSKFSSSQEKDSSPRSGEQKGKSLRDIWGHDYPVYSSVANKDNPLTNLETEWSLRDKLESASTEIKKGVIESHDALLKEIKDYCVGFGKDQQRIYAEIYNNILTKDEELSFTEQLYSLSQTNKFNKKD